MKSAASYPANLRLQSRARMPRQFLVLTLALACASSYSLPLRAQGTVDSSARLPGIAISIDAAAAPLNHVLPATKTKAPAASPVIVIGFLGGRVKKGNAIHREVQLAEQLRQQHPNGVYIAIFANSHGRRAFRQILKLLDTNHNGSLSTVEKQHARIILYGHSWGASETVILTHWLDHEGIPVQLAILVDRVPKFGSGDETIPPNVAQAVNFYQLDGLLHGLSTIRAADPADTRILGNYQFNYKDKHIDCTHFPWYARLFMGPHIEIENDPRVWNQVESLIAAKLPPESPVIASN